MIWLRAKHERRYYDYNVVIDAVTTQSQRRNGGANSHRRIELPCAHQKKNGLPAILGEQTGFAKSNSVGRLSFRELRGAPSLSQAGLFSFLHPAITRQQVRIAQGIRKFVVVDPQGPGDAQLASAGLSRHASPVNANNDINFTRLTGLLQRGHHGISILLSAEIIVKRPFVNRDFSLARTNAYPGHRRFTSSGSQSIASDFVF